MHSCIHLFEAHSSRVDLIPRKPTEEENSIFLLHKISYRITQELLQGRTRILQDIDRQSTRLGERSFRGEKMGFGYKKHYEEVGYKTTSLFQSELNRKSPSIE